MKGQQQMVRNWKSIPGREHGSLGALTQAGVQGVQDGGQVEGANIGPYEPGDITISQSNRAVDFSWDRDIMCLNEVSLCL